MAKKNQSNNSRQAAQVANQTPETINAATIPAPEEINNPVTPEITGDPQTDNQTETAPEEFQHLDNFPTLAEGLKFEVNGYKVTITGREYVKDGKWPWTAFNAVVIAPDGTSKDFQKVRNTAICNFCKSSTGITHNGGERSITKVLSDMELAAEVTRRCSQIRGLLDRAKELYTKYTGGSLELPEIDLNTPILDALTADNNQRRESAEKAKAANAERTARKEARDLTAEISKLIAAGDFQKAAELMQQKAAAQAVTETETDETE